MKKGCLLLAAADLLLAAALFAGYRPVRDAQREVFSEIVLIHEAAGSGEALEGGPGEDKDRQSGADLSYADDAPRVALTFDADVM